MNYLRGALSAASQYYKDLPPINPSTLTGAIDVIVIERPVEGKDGETELACSPFHVRFGKWQILRPGEKKVNVLVNGKPIPFDMKIGDAGEAFFVFETDEDVPQDLLTSPILGPSKGGDETVERDSGRFGTHRDKEFQLAENKDSLKEIIVTNGDINDEQEPTFLDLSSTGRSPSPSSTLSRTPSPAPSAEGTHPSSRSPSPPTSLSTTSESENKRSSGNFSPPSFLETTKAVINLSSATVASKASDGAHSMANLTLSDGGESSRKSSADDMDGSQEPMGTGKGDEILPKVAGDDGEPPEVVYGHDVVYDIEGYHSHQRSDSTSTHESRTSSAHLNPSQDHFQEPSTPRGRRMEGKAKEEHAKTPTVKIQVPNGPRTGVGKHRSGHRPPTRIQLKWRDSNEGTDGSILSNPPSRPSSGGPLCASISEPSKVSPSTISPSSSAQTSPTLNAMRVPSPEYSWEWGAFPVRSATEPGFSDPLTDLSMHRARSVPIGVLGPSTNEFGTGGRLLPDIEDDKRFWVELEGQKFTFELSLCGALDEKDEVSALEAFESRRVSYSTFLKDDGLVESKELVLKWNERYISKDDSSPLMSALPGWRDAAMAELPPRSPPTGPTTLGVSPPNKSHSRGSSWVRWWTRSNSGVKPGDEGEITSNRPPMLPSASAPAESRADSVVNEPLATTVSDDKASLRTVSPPPPPTPPESKIYYVKTLRLTSDQLRALNLKKGANSITFSLSSTGVVACTARIFKWDYKDRIVISDIDGTITKSDALGHVFTMIGRDWTHSGVAKLYTDICRNGYKIMYLTSRAIGQADSTREYLKGISQGNYQLPEGPVIMSPDRLMASLHREVIMRKPEVFKMACLRDIQRLFENASGNPFYAGFGNRITDALSYRSVNVPSAKIFTIDSSGEVKMELLELAGYKSSYIHMTDLVDQMFPPIHRKWTAEFTDFNYWRTPIQEFELPDLSPPSPTLSARSDASGQSRLSRLRNFSLGRASSTQNLKVEQPSFNGQANGDGQVRSRTLSVSSNPVRRSPSPRRSPLMGPSITAHDFEEDDDVSEVASSWLERRRTTSMDGSMPGSLPGSLSSHFLDEDELGQDEDERSREDSEGIEGSDGGPGEEEVEAKAEEAFDEDLLATGEMDNIPFL